MTKNKSIKIAVATLLVSNVGNTVTASETNVFDLQSPVRLGTQIYQVDTPETAADLKQRAAQLKDKKTPALRSKAEAKLDGKKGRLPHRVLEQLINTELKAYKSEREIEFNKLEIDVKAAQDRAIARSKEVESNSEIQALIESLQNQRIEASELGRSFAELAAEKERKEEQIQKLIADKAVKEAEIRDIQSANESEKKDLVEALEETLMQQQSDLERLTAAQIRLENDLYEKNKALTDSKSKLDSLMPLVNAVRSGAVDRAPLVTTARAEIPVGTGRNEGATEQQQQNTQRVKKEKSKYKPGVNIDESEQG
ncbi:MAG: hypothetical protein C0432_04215 [Candidatus Puniceispirillum sp.]|nr:hypothetical protein [Candidatus Pelagibacter sp.]MBA4283480.1 hypothetical protein [Candidatus Puniceispirillum sp.]